MSVTGELWIGAERPPLGFFVRIWSQRALQQRAAEIENDIARHTGVRSGYLGAEGPLRSSLHFLAFAGGGIILAIVALALVKGAGVGLLLAFLFGAGGLVAGFAFMARPWHQASSILLAHFQKETGTLCADPDTGLEDIAVTVEPKGEWEIWRTHRVERKEFVRGGGAFPALAWSLFPSAGPQVKLNDLQEVLNRHWQFHQRFPQLASRRPR